MVESYSQYHVTDAELYDEAMNKLTHVPEVLHVHGTGGSVIRVEELNFEEGTGMFRSVEKDTLSELVEQGVLEKSGDISDVAGR